MMDQQTMWTTKGIDGLTCEAVMSRGISASMATMRMRMRRNEHRKSMMDQCKMWSTEGIVLESTKIALKISDM